MDITAASAPLRSLFVLNSLSVGGAEKQVLTLLNSLRDEGHVSYLQCLKEGAALQGQLEDHARANLLPHLGVSHGLDLRVVPELARRIDRLAVDLLVCTNMYALLYGWLARALAARRRQVRLVEVFHTTDVASRRERLEMGLYRRVTPFADLLVYVCHAQAGHWRAQGLRARADTVIYNGVDLRRFEDRWSAEDKQHLRQARGVGQDDFLVGLCAVMRPEKAHGDLLQAVALMRRAGLPVKAWLIGDGPLRRQIESDIDALDLRAHVQVTGLLDDVRPAMAACDAMVLASHAVETFSIAALEAMALGKPMVMTAIGGAAELVGGPANGLLYPPGDIPALAHALASIADRERARAMGERAARHVRERFGFARMVRSYAQAFEALAGHRPVRGDARVAVA